MLIFLALIEGEENKNKFIELYEKYKNIVFAISIKIIKDYHLAEDATQITFTKIAKNIEKIVSLNDLSQKSYISTIAKKGVYVIYNTNDENILYKEKIKKEIKLIKDSNISKDELIQIIKEVYDD